MKNKVMYLLLGLVFMLSFLPLAQAEKQPEKQETPAKQSITVPNSVMNIAKENTYPNTMIDMPRLEPSDLTKELFDSSKTKIENPELIRMFNETTVNSTPFALGYKAFIYLGQWPLNYESVETAPNWEYQKINTNYYDNRGGNCSLSNSLCARNSKNCTRWFNSKGSEFGSSKRYDVDQSDAKVRVTTSISNHHWWWNKERSGL